MEYEFYDVVKAVVKKVSMVNPKCAKLSKVKVYSGVQEAGFEDTIHGWVDVLDLVKDIKSIRKKQIIGYKALGYDNWEIAAIMGTYERKIDRDIYWIKSFLRKSVGKSAAKRLYIYEREKI